MRRYDGVLFDLLTGLLDSWTLWNDVAGSEEQGLAWRREYLRVTYGTNEYRPYEDLVEQAALATALRPGMAAALAARYGELRPWPGVRQVLSALRLGGLRLGVVTNCSLMLGRVAAAEVGVAFDAVVTAEEVGFYKPNAQAYRAGLTALGLAADRCVFVAGSAYDLVGAGRIPLDTYWHDRIGMAPPAGAPVPLAREPTLAPLLALCGISNETEAAM